VEFPLTFEKNGYAVHQSLSHQFIQT